jgi:dATP pyrophosphohydrolase
MDRRFEQSGEATGLPNHDFRWDGKGRAPFQVLVLPYREMADRTEYAVFRRADAGYWQFIAGGGEDSESPIEAAKREANEEAGIAGDAHIFHLDSQNTVPVLELAGSLRWGPELLVVPEFTFAARVGDRQLRTGPEHTEYRWVDYETCREMLHWHSNRNALVELHHRILHGMIPPAGPHG